MGRDRWNLKRLRRWISTHLRVQDPQGGLVAFGRGNAIQRDFMDRSQALRGHATWDVMIKPRQCGGSTQVMGAISGLCIQNPGLSVLAVCAKDQDFQEVLYKWRLMQVALENDPDSGHPGKTHDSKEQYSYKNGSRVSWTTIGGTENVADAVGRAGSFALVWMTELAFPDKPELVPIAIEALRPAIKKAGAGVVVDTTPNDPEGAGRAYAELVDSVDAGDLPGETFFWPWWMDPENVSDLRSTPEDFARSLTEEERELVTREALSLRQIAFRRSMMVKPSYTVEEARAIFMRQYPETRAEAFAVRRSESILSEAVMETLRRRFQFDDGPHPLLPEQLDSLTLPDDRDPMRWRFWGAPRARSLGYVRVWALPVHGGSYFAGEDCSDGKPKGDWQTLTILDKAGDTVVEVRLRMAPIRFAAISQRLLTAYHAPCRYEAQDGAVVHKYVTEPQTQELLSERATFPGELSILSHTWADCELAHINVKTRPRLMEAAFSVVEAADGSGCLTPECFKEMGDLVRTPQGKVEARKGVGCHDDLIKSKGLAGWLREDRMLRARSEETRRAIRSVRPRSRARGKYVYLN